MFQNLLFLLGALTLLTACGRQNNLREATRPPNAPAPAFVGVDTVQKPGNNIMTIYQDKQNIYWFASWKDGLYRYDGETILHFTTKSGLPNNRVEDIREDQQGNLFINTSGGVCRLTGARLTLLPAVEGAEWALQPGDLWFKTSQFDGKVYRYDGQNLYSLQLPECRLGREWLAKYPTTPTPYGIYTIYTDSQKNIWFGTAALGACRYNGATFDWISEEDVNELHNNPSNGVRSIIEDKDGFFWFNSAYRYRVYGNNQEEKDTFYSREKSIGNLDGRPDSDLWEYLSIVKDNNDALWIATYNDGVWRYDGQKTTYFPMDINLFSIYKDNYGDLWLGTHENGVYKFNGKTFERFKP